MSRSGYSDDYDNQFPNAIALYRNTVKRAMAGKRGLSFLAELAAALDSMTNKRLVAGCIEDDNGDVCAIGRARQVRGLPNNSSTDGGYAIAVAQAKDLGIPTCLAAEIMDINDHYGDTPEQRWTRVRARVGECIERSQSRRNR